MNLNSRKINFKNKIEKIKENNANKNYCSKFIYILTIVKKFKIINLNSY